MNRRNILKSFAATIPLISDRTIIEQPSKEKTSIKIAHITDVHLSHMVGAVAGFERCLHYIQNHLQSYDIIINSGDCIMNAHNRTDSATKRQWKLFQEVLKNELSIKIFHSVGNHDIACEGKSQLSFADGKNWAMDELGLNMPYYSIDLADWRIIFLDSVQAKADGSWYTAFIDEVQLDWLKNELQSTSKPILIVSHIPILAACVFFDGKNYKNGHWEIPGSWMHTDALQLTELFHKHKNVKAAISGHIHLTDAVQYNGINYICNGAVSGRWWMGSYHHTAPGYGHIELISDGSIINKYLAY